MTVPRRGQLAGRLLLRGAAEYEQARVGRIFNARRPDRFPAAVLLDHGFTSAYSARSLTPVPTEVRLRDRIAAGATPGPRMRAASFERDNNPVQWARTARSRRRPARARFANLLAIMQDGAFWKLSRQLTAG